MSILDTLPIELSYTIISYLIDTVSINKLITNSKYLRLKLSDDVEWKVMLYQNMSNPVINENYYRYKFRQRNFEYRQVLWIC
jgi:hypothetical protein